MDAYDPVSLIRAARRDFAAFYARVDVIEAGLLDGLVMAKAGPVTGMTHRGKTYPMTFRADVERTMNRAEQVFAGLRVRCGIARRRRPRQRTETLFDGGYVRRSEITRGHSGEFARQEL